MRPSPAGWEGGTLFLATPRRPRHAVRRVSPIGVRLGCAAPAWRPAVLALPAFSCAAPRDERAISRRSIAALRQLQCGWANDEERADGVGLGRAAARRAWGRAVRSVRGACRSSRLTSVLTTNRAAPGGARSRRAAHVRPRRTESAQDPAWLRGPLTRDSQRCTRELALLERAEAREATKPRATSATAASWAAPRSDARPPAGSGGWKSPARGAHAFAGRAPRRGRCRRASLTFSRAIRRT